MSSPSSQVGPTLLDIDLAMSQIGDADATREMLVLLQESLSRDVPEISNLLQAGDVPGANRLLHALKGFIPIFCQAELCDQVVRVEGLSKNAASTELTAAYAGLRPRLEQLLAEVSAHLLSSGKAA